MNSASILTWMVLRDVEPAAVRLAIEEGGCRPDVPGCHIPPLVLACKEGKVDIAAALIQAGASLRSTPSWWCQDGLEAGDYHSAIWYAFSSLSFGPWEKSSTNEWFRILHMFIAAGLDINTDVPCLLHLLMLPHINAKTVQELLDLGADPKCKAVFDHVARGSYLYGRVHNSRVIHYEGEFSTSLSASNPLDILRRRETPFFGLVLRDKIEASRTPCVNTRFEINQRRKIRTLLKTLASPAPGSIRDIIHGWKFVDIPRFVNDLVCLVELDAVLDLKQPKYKADLEELFRHNMPVAGFWDLYLGPQLGMSTLFNLRRAVEILVHHEIDFVPLDLDLHVKFSAVSFMLSLLKPDQTLSLDRGANVCTTGFCGTYIHDDVFWDGVDAELSVLEKWVQFASSRLLRGCDKYQEPWYAEDMWAEFWGHFGLASSLRNNLRGILRACFKLDLHLGRPTSKEHVYEDERKLQRASMLKYFRREMAMRWAQVKA